MKLPLISWKYFRNHVVGASGRSLLIFSESDSSVAAVIPQNEAFPAEKPWAASLFGSNPQDGAFIPEKLDAFLDVFTGLSKAPSVNSQTLNHYWSKSHSQVSALNLNLTDKCNLACVYCYAKGGNYDRINREMTLAAAKSGLEAALLKSDLGREFRIEFFGGEPLLNVSTIEGVLEWQKTASSWKDRPLPSVNRISSNLTLLDEPMIRLLKEGRMIVSISLDGISHVQNSQRPFKDGRGSYSTIMQNIEKLRSACPKSVIVARMTVFKHDVDLFPSIQELAATDLFNYVSVYPASVYAEKGLPEPDEATQSNGKKLPNFDSPGKYHFSTAFREQFLHFVRQYPKLVGRGRFRGCLELNRYCEAILTGKTVLNHCRAGSGYFTLSPDGSVHPCHRLVGDTSWDLGPFSWDEKSLPEKLRVWQTPVDRRFECRECHVRFLCGGGCKQQLKAATGDMLGHDPRVCAFSHLLFESALTIVSGLPREALTGASTNTPYVDALKSSFSELSRLFVFCGQPLEKNRRILPFKPREFVFEGTLFAAQYLNWE